VTATVARRLRAHRVRRVADRGFGYSRDTEVEQQPVPAWVEGYTLGRRVVA
jgi:hypothetical protein